MVGSVDIYSLLRIKTILDLILFHDIVQVCYHVNRDGEVGIHGCIVSQTSSVTTLLTVILRIPFEITFGDPKTPSRYGRCRLSSRLSINGKLFVENYTKTWVYLCLVYALWFTGT